MFHWLAPMLPPTLNLPSTISPVPTPDKAMSAANPCATLALFSPAASSEELPGAGAFQALRLSVLTTCVVASFTPSKLRAVISSNPVPDVLICAPLASPRTSVPKGPLTASVPLRSPPAALNDLSGPSAEMALKVTRPSPPTALNVIWVVASLPVICKR